MLDSPGRNGLEFNCLADYVDREDCHQADQLYTEAGFEVAESDSEVAYFSLQTW